jgi:hypothetical protein
MPASKQSQHRRKFSLPINGKTYQAYYYIEGDIITLDVVTEDGTVLEKTTEIGTSAELTAHMLLRELVRSGRLQEPGC